MDTGEVLTRLTDYGADIAGALARFMGDAEMYKKYFYAFLQDQGFETLGQAIAAGDYKRAFAEAHNIKGVAANLGLTSMAGATAAMTEALRSRDYEGFTPPCDPQPLYDELCSELARIKALV